MNETYKLAISRLKTCIQEITTWASKNFLKLNEAKTKFLNITRSSPKAKIPDFSLIDSEFLFSNCMKNLEFIFDQNLNLKTQINKVCRYGFFMLKNLWRISSKVPTISLKIQLVHGCILSHIDYCNALYFGLPKKDIKKLQRLLNAAVRFIYSLRRSDRVSITEYMKKCHFLPVHLRIQYKICVLVFKCLHGTAPGYLIDLLEKKKTLDKLRIKDDTTLLQLDHYEKVAYKNRKFSVAPPTLWNQLPKDIRESFSLSIFKTKSKLKTYYFELF